MRVFEYPGDGRVRFFSKTSSTIHSPKSEFVQAGVVASVDLTVFPGNAILTSEVGIPDFRN